MSVSMCLILFIPLIVGAFFGAFVRRQHWPWLPLGAAAPVLSIAVVFLFFYVLDMAFRIVNPQWQNQYPVYVQSLGGVLLVTPGLLLYGALPAVLGYFLGYCLCAEINAILRR